MVKLINICSRDEAYRTLQKYRSHIVDKMMWCRYTMFGTAVLFAVMAGMRWDDVITFWRDGLCGETAGVILSAALTKAGACIVLLFMYAFYQHQKEALSKFPNAACKYYAMIDGKNILGCELLPMRAIFGGASGRPTHCLEFDLEDIRTHVVTYDCINLYGSEVRTDIDETVVDIGRGIVCIPVGTSYTDT